MDNLKKKNVAFTIASKNYLKFTLVLRESFLRHNPGFEFFIVVMDKFSSKEEFDAYVALSNQGVRFLNYEEIKNGLRVPELEEMLFKYDVLELNTAIKPFVLEYFVNAGAEKIFFIDPDIYFFDSLEPVVKMLDKQDVVLTPHILTEYGNLKPEDGFPNETHLLLAGVYNLGFIGISNRPAAVKMIQWWQRRLFEFGYLDVAFGMHVDQNWMTFLPSLCETTEVVRHLGCNVAYWNLHERPVEERNGKFFVGNDPLIFFHFSGFPLNNLESVSKHQTRHSLTKFPNLRKVFQLYKDAVLGMVNTVFEKKGYFFGKFRGTDIPVPDYSRQFLMERAGIFSREKSPYLNDENVLKKVKDAFAVVLPSGFTRLEQEALNDARRKGGPLFLEHFVDAKDKKDFIAKRVYGGNLPPEEYKKVDWKLKSELDFGLNIFGYFENQIGVSEAARQFVKYVYHTGVPYVLRNVVSEHHKLLNKKDIYQFEQYFADKIQHQYNYAFFNADEIEARADALRPEFKRAKTLAVWWWEFNDYLNFPKAFELVDGVVAYSPFVCEAISKVAPAGKHVIKAKFPYVRIPENEFSARDMRKDLNVSADDFFVFYNFDFFSSYDRKNPEAALAAFELAFKPTDQVRLILKGANSNRFKKDFEVFQARIAQSPLKTKVTYLEETFSRAEMAKLISQTDCYLSPHRSEGLGLGMLEAMSYGVPVIGTAFGGNMDFMTKENSMLIDFKMTTVKEDFGPYRKGWNWADPSVDQAAESLKKLYQDSAFRKTLGISASKSIEVQFDKKIILNDIQKSLSLFQ